MHKLRIYVLLLDVSPNPVDAMQNLTVSSTHGQGMKDINKCNHIATYVRKYVTMYYIPVPCMYHIIKYNST